MKSIQFNSIKNAALGSIFVIVCLLCITPLSLSQGDIWSEKTPMTTIRSALCTDVLDSLTSLAQIEWQRYPQNPVLNVGLDGKWDDLAVREPEVIFDGTTYHCWYSGQKRTRTGGQIGYANSPDGITWTKHPDPVMGVGPSGHFDDGAVLGPCVIKVGDTLKMWYQGWGGDYYENRIGYATSLDGIKWDKYSANPVLDTRGSGKWHSYGVFFPCVIFDGVTYHIWYGGTAPGKPFEIGYATSADGITWTEHPDNPVLHAGRAGSWEEGVNCPYVLFDGSTFHMWYRGANANYTSRIGYANSPDGVNWTKADDVNPVLDLVPDTWERDGVELGSILFDQTDSTYKMWYSGLQGDIWRIGFASSDPLLNLTSFVKNVEVNKSYAVAGSDSICITAKLKNPTKITLVAKIEAPDQTVVDSLQLYDDGNHNDENAGDSLYANIWPVLSTEEQHYYVDLQITRVDTDTVIQHMMNNIALFTTIGPVQAAESPTIDCYYNERYNSQYFQLVLHNKGSVATAVNLKVKVNSVDPRIYKMLYHTRDFPDLAAGEIDTSSLSKYFAFNYADGITPDSTFNNPIQFNLTVSSNGYPFWISTFDFTADSTATAIEENFDIVLKLFVLHQNYPNPFNPETRISYQVPKQACIVLKVMNLLGQEVRTLVDENKPVGFYEVMWNGKNDFGQRVASGVYLYRLESSDFVRTKKMVLLQ